MPVGDQDAAETVVGHALGHIEHEVEQVFHPDVDGAGKVHVVGLEAVGDERHQQDVATGPPGGFLADGPDEEVVSIERQVRPVVFHRADGENHHRLSFNGLAQLGPGVMLIEIAFPFHMRSLVD